MDARLEELNDKTVRVLIPVIFIVVLLMIIGLIGNPLVIYFFGFRLKPTASYMFIVTLACFDLITCSVSMPLEVVDLVKFYTFEDSNACRLLRFVNYFASIASGAVLIAIAVDRFRRICRPFNKQISIKMAKIIIVAVMGISLFFSWPSLAIYRVVEVNITSTSDSIIGYDCTTVRNEDYKFYITIYNIVLFVLFLGSIIVLVVLYSLVGKQLFKLKSFRVYATKRRTQKSQKSSSEIGTVSGTHVPDNLSKSDEERAAQKISDPAVSSETIVSFSSKGGLKIGSEGMYPDDNDMSAGSLKKIELNAEPACNVENIHPESIGNDENNSTNVNSKTNEIGDEKQTNFADKRKTQSSKKIENNQKMQAQTIDTKKYTVITILISIGFILSFLPYLCLITWRTLSRDYEPNLLSDSALVAFQIFLRSFLFSSVCNPIIYGFLNTDFKNMITRNIKRVCCVVARRPDKSSSTHESAMSKST